MNKRKIVVKVRLSQFFGSLELLHFDNKTHSVTLHGQSISLQPLSFRLLEVLAKSPGQTYSVHELIESVWTNTQVSPETLKQRVFVLRKAIEESGIKGLSIQAIRGEGYRLLMADEALEASISKPIPRKLIAIAATTVVIIALLTYWFFLRSSEFILNNRIILWANVPLEEMHLEGQSAFEAWRTLIAEENKQGSLQLVLSNRVESMLVPNQAREDRAGLISNFELVTTHDERAVRLSIIEPTTATVLRSDFIKLSDKYQMTEVMQSQFTALSNLIFSNRLCLNEAQRDNSQAPIWQELRRIANQS